MQITLTNLAQVNLGEIVLNYPTETITFFISIAAFYFSWTVYKKSQFSLSIDLDRDNTIQKEKLCSLILSISNSSTIAMSIREPYLLLKKGVISRIITKILLPWSWNYKFFNKIQRYKKDSFSIDNNGTWATVPHLHLEPFKTYKVKATFNPIKELKDIEYIVFKTADKKLQHVKLYRGYTPEI